MSRIIAAAARSDALAQPNTDRVLLELEEEEASALASLAFQIEQLVITTEPSDESVTRLYPVAYADAVEAADFARFTRPALQERKVDAAQAVRLAIEAGTELDEDSSRLSVEISPDELWHWLTFLTDLRLVLADSIDLDDGSGPDTADSDGSAVDGIDGIDDAQDADGQAHATRRDERLSTADADLLEAHQTEAAELRNMQRGVFEWAAFLQDSLVAAAEHGQP